MTYLSGESSRVTLYLPWPPGLTITRVFQIPPPSQWSEYRCLPWLQPPVDTYKEKLFIVNTNYTLSINTKAWNSFTINVHCIKLIITRKRIYNKEALLMSWESLTCPWVSLLPWRPSPYSGVETYSRATQTSGPTWRSAWWMRLDSAVCLPP